MIGSIIEFLLNADSDFERATLILVVRQHGGQILYEKKLRNLIRPPQNEIFECLMNNPDAVFEGFGMETECFIPLESFLQLLVPMEAEDTLDGADNAAAESNQIESDPNSGYVFLAIRKDLAILFAVWPAAQVQGSAVDVGRRLSKRVPLVLGVLQDCLSLIDFRSTLPSPAFYSQSAPLPDVKLGSDETTASGAMLPSESASQSDTLSDFTSTMRANFSKRETSVMKACLQGLSVKKIGIDLGISPHTVSVHIRSVYQKCGVKTRGELQFLYSAFIAARKG